MDRLELEHLLSLVAKLGKDTLELALVLRALLRATHCAHLRRRTANKDLDVIATGSCREVLLEQLRVHKAGETAPALARLGDTVHNLEAVVLLRKLVKALTEQNVLLGVVGIDKRSLRLVVLVVCDGLNQLPNRSDTRATGDKANVLELVGLIRELRDGALEVDSVTDLEVLKALGQLAVGLVSTAYARSA